MAEIIEAIFDQLAEHWMKIITAALFAGIGWYFGKRKAIANWEKREFFHRMNVSLNIIQDGTLKLRTLNETTCDRIFPNSQAAEKVIEAAKETTLDDPILKLPDDDYWYYLNSVLNEISEQFAFGSMRMDLGQPINCAQYLICLTSEADGGIRMRKVRALVVKKSLLTNLPEEQPKLESPNHSTRWKTLKKLAKAYQSNPNRFMDIEICL